MQCGITIATMGYVLFHRVFIKRTIGNNAFRASGKMGMLIKIKFDGYVYEQLQGI